MTLPARALEADLGDRIVTLYAHINAATCELLRLIARFDAKQHAARQGFVSTAHWLGYRCGIGLNAAREKVRVAQALITLPQVADAFERGWLSYSKVRALTRVANPANEAALIDIARHSTAAQAERILRQYRQTLARERKSTGEPEPPPAQWHCWWTEDGDLAFKGRLSAEQGALLLKALDRRLRARGPTVDAVAESQHHHGALAAAERRDQGCRFPGCTHRRFVDAHHVHHWSRGGTTTLDNLLLLCRRHHRAVHELGFRIEAERPPKGATRFRFFTPDGAELPPVADDLGGGNVVALIDHVTAETSPDPGRLAPRLPQSRPDYGHIN